MKFVIGENGFLETERVGRERLDSLSSLTRREIIELIADNPLNTQEIANKVGLDRQTVYYHLKELVDSGIIESTDSKPRIYRLCSESFCYIPKNMEFKGSGREKTGSESITKRLNRNEYIDWRVIVEDSDTEDSPKYRYKAGEISSLLFNGSQKEKTILTQSEASEIGLEHNYILITRTEKLNNFVVDLPDEIKLEDVVRIQGTLYSGNKTGAILKLEDRILILGKTNFGVATAIKTFRENYNSIESHVLVQGFGNGLKVRDYDIISRY